MIVSLLDHRGVRHEIDLEAWVSPCCAWVVVDAREDGSGKAELHVGRGTFIPVYQHGTSHAAAGTFAPSDEPITCLACIAGEVFTSPATWPWDGTAPLLV